MKGSTLDNKNNLNLKICAGASSGGHMTELFSLLSEIDAWPVKPSVYLTSRSIWASKLQEYGPTYVVGECDRTKPLQILITAWKSLSFILKERPDIIITTGSLPIAITCLIGKVFGTKIVWIDSIAQIDELSMSGKLVLKYADVFFTQWPEVAEKHYPKAEHKGELM